MLLEGIFDPSVCVAEIGLSGEFPELFPDEWKAISGAMTRRQREFTAGRTCARRAMRQLGIGDVSIPMGADRAPIWPSGITGSISHSTTRCVAAVARHSDGIKSIGIDIEEAAPLDDALTEEICTPAERIWLDSQRPLGRGLLRTAIFSAKECVYKCQYPLSRTIFGFQDIRIEVNLEEESFTAHFEIDVSPFKTGDRLDGRIAFREGCVISGAALR